MIIVLLKQGSCSTETHVVLLGQWLVKARFGFKEAKYSGFSLESRIAYFVLTVACK